MNSFYKNKSITDYVKLILLVIMFMFCLIFKASIRDYILLVVLLLIEYAFKIGYNYINSISYTISDKFYKNMFKILSIINFEFDIYFFLFDFFKFKI